MPLSPRTLNNTQQLVGGIIINIFPPETPWKSFKLNRSIPYAFSASILPIRPSSQIIFLSKSPVLDYLKIIASFNFPRFIQISASPLIQRNVTRQSTLTLSTGVRAQRLYDLKQKRRKQMKFKSDLQSRLCSAQATPQAYTLTTSYNN